MGQRVNKVVIGTVSDQGFTAIKLMNTNTVVAKIASSNIGMPDYSEIKGKCSKMKYAELTREKVTRLIKDGKIPGYEWVDKQSVPTVHYREGSLGMVGTNRVTDTLKEMGYECRIVDTKYKFEKYANGSVREATIVVMTTINNNKADFTVNIRSGQLAKPAVFTTQDGREHSVNVTNIKKLYEGRL